jgi:CubicO group peptidase (beta-lactamase class C family)
MIHPRHRQALGISWARLAIKFWEKMKSIPVCKILLLATLASLIMLASCRPVDSSKPLLPTASLAISVPPTPIIITPSLQLSPTPRTDCRSRYPSAPAEREYWPTNEWKVSSPEEHCLDPKKVEKAAWYFENNFTTSSLLIVRHGELVYEKYFNSYNKPDWPVPIFSVTKSVLSSLVGIAITQGALDSVDHQVSEYFPEYFYPHTDPRMAQVTLYDLLTMSSGFYWIEDSEIEGRWMQSGNLVESAINLEFSDQPGTVFTYSSANTQLLSAILTKIVGEPLRDYAQRNLFSPLGITRRMWNWAMDDQGYYIGGFGMDLRPQDMARFGYLFLNQGYWDGKQIISPDWVQQSTNVQIHTGFGKDYGFLWWIRPGEDQTAYEAIGYGGQSIYIFPDLDMVVVATGRVSTGGGGAPDPDPIIHEWIEKAVTDQSSSRP